MRRGDRDIPTGVVVIVAVLFLNNFAAAASRPLLPVYVERELAFAPAFSATLLALETAVGGVISLFAGALADGIGHKPVLLLGFLGFMAGLLQFTTAVPWLLVTLALLLGLGHGLRSTAGQSYLLSAARPGSVGVATAAFFLGGTIGSALGAALAGGIIEAYGFATFALVGLALSLAPIGLALWKLPPVPAGAVAGRSLASFRGFWTIIARREVLLLGGLRFFPTASWGVFTLALPLLIFRATDSVLMAALYSTVGLILSTVSQFSVGRWSDRHGRRLPTYLFLLGLVTAAGLAAVGPRLGPTAICGRFAWHRVWLDDVGAGFGRGSRADIGRRAGTRGGVHSRALELWISHRNHRRRPLARCESGPAAGIGRALQCSRAGLRRCAVPTGAGRPPCGGGRLSAPACARQRRVHSMSPAR